MFGYLLIGQAATDEGKDLSLTLGQYGIMLLVRHGAGRQG